MDGFPSTVPFSTRAVRVSLYRDELVTLAKTAMAEVHVPDPAYAYSPTWIALAIALLISLLYHAEHGLWEKLVTLLS
jgi:succinate dehydrogenase hydrophobic anchor subunit